MLRQWNLKFEGFYASSCRGALAVKKRFVDFDLDARFCTLELPVDHAYLKTHTACGDPARCYTVVWFWLGWSL
jgi:hypothetical protein